MIDLGDQFCWIAAFLLEYVCGAAGGLKVALCQVFLRLKLRGGLVEVLPLRWRTRQAEIKANLVQTKIAWKRASQDMNIVILDGCRDNPFRKLGGIARGVALPNGTFTADAAAPINNSRVPDHFQAYFLKYPLGSFTRLARNRLKVLLSHHPAPQSPVAQTANPVPENRGPDRRCEALDYGVQ